MDRHCRRWTLACHVRCLVLKVRFGAGHLNKKRQRTNVAGESGASSGANVVGSSSCPSVGGGMRTGGTDDGKIADFVDATASHPHHVRYHEYSDYGVRTALLGCSHSYRKGVVTFCSWTRNICYPSSSCWSSRSDQGAL